MPTYRTDGNERAQSGCRSLSPRVVRRYSSRETPLVAPHAQASLLDLWDRHDWTALFHASAERWHDGGVAVVAVVGHALMEQSLVPGRLLVGKCLVVPGDPAGAGARVAASIAAGGILAAPSELRPLPLAGSPGWHAGQGEAFYAQEGYFRPLREGRVYPPPL